MDLFGRAAARLRTVPRASLENPGVPLTDASLISVVGGPGTFTGRPVTVATALGQSAVWQATNLIAGTCAGLPLHAFRKDAESRRPLTSGPAARLLAEPHPDLTPLELWELTFGSLVLWGNAYLLKLRNALGQITELWWINPARVKCDRYGDDPPLGRTTGQKYYVLDGGSSTEMLLHDDVMLHIPGFGYDGICGVSVVRAARQSIALGMAAEEFGATFYGSGSLATGILQTEQRLEKEDAHRIKALWREGAATGLDGAHDIRVVGSGAKYQQLTIAPEDAQFLESREFQVTDVARWFGIPPHLLMQTDKSTSWGTGIESQNTQFVQYTLRRYLGRVEQRLTRILRPEPVYARFSLAGLLRGDSAARAAFYGAMFNLGAISPNEIRALEDLDPIDNGDRYFVPLNLGELGADPAPADPAPAPDPTPADQTQETTTNA